VEELKRKKGVFEEHCAAVGRDPKSVLLTIGMNIILVDKESEGKALFDRIPDERKPMVRIATPEQAAETLRPYVDAGFGGFTLSNMTSPTVESIGRAGELIKLMAGVRVG